MAGVKAWEIFGSIGLDGLGKTQRQLAAFNAMGGTSAGMVTRLNKKMLLLAGGTAAVGAGALIAGGKSVAAFADFDEKMTESLAIMGDVSEAMREDMAGAARDVARSTVFSADQAAESYFFLASAGLDAKQSVAALPQVAAFAQAGMFDMATATDLATDAQSALGLTSADAAENLRNMTRVTDVLVKANTLANASVEQFSTALTRQAGAALKTFDKDMEEGVAVLAAFADQGIKAEMAGTGLARLLRLLPEQAVKNADAYAQMGIEVFDAEGKMRNMADVVGDMEGALGGLSDEQRTAALNALGFKGRIQQVILPLLGTSDAIREYEQELRVAAGTTQEIADNQMDTLNRQMGLLGDNIRDMALAIGSKLEPAVKSIVTNTNEWFDAWQEILGGDTEAQLDAMARGLQGLSGAAAELRAVGIAGEIAEVRAEMDAVRDARDAGEMSPGDAFFALDEMEERLATLRGQLQILGESAAGRASGAGGDGDAGNDTGRDGGGNATEDQIAALERQIQVESQLLEARTAAGRQHQDVWTETFGIWRRANALLSEGVSLTRAQEAAVLDVQNQAQGLLNMAIGDGGKGFVDATTSIQNMLGDMDLPEVFPIEEARSAAEPGIDAYISAWTDDRLKQDMRGIGMNLLSSLASGTFDAGDFLKQTILTVAQSFLLGPLSGFFGIASPSKVMVGVGQDLMQGIMVGIEGQRMALRSTFISATSLPDVRLPGTVGPSLARARPSLPIDLANMPPARNPLAASRDAEWQRFLRASNDVARDGGFT